MILEEFWSGKHSRVYISAGNQIILLWSFCSKVWSRLSKPLHTTVCDLLFIECCGIDWNCCTGLLRCIERDTSFFCWVKHRNIVFAKSVVFSSLPKVVKRRVNALKNLQVKCAHIEAKFYEEVHELERKYAALYQPLFDKVCRLRASLPLHFVTVNAALSVLIQFKGYKQRAKEEYSGLCWLEPEKCLPLWKWEK